MRDDPFWEGFALSADLFDPLCKCIGVLGSDSAAMGTTYACFIYMLDHLNGVITDYDGQRDHGIQSLFFYRWKRMYRLVHALAFFCDPFYSELRLNLTRHIGAHFVELGMGNLRLQCRTALSLMAVGTMNWTALGFSASSSTSACIRRPYSRRTPRYCGPGSSAGVEHQNTTDKRVHTSARNRTGSGKVECQVEMAYNSVTSRCALPPNRQPFEHVIAALWNRDAQVKTGLLDNELLLAMRRQHGDVGADYLEGYIDPVDLMLDDLKLAE
uniref:Uncharacterized protein n=1 Tax=Hyaloperonospora arabidopsidis (strain Emoy2) TaxID=559515 RepID=M4C2V7_HYAAE